MRKILLIVLLFWGNCILGQPTKNSNDSSKVGYSEYVNSMIQTALSDTNRKLKSEGDIKAELILYSLYNAQSVAADANVRMAKIAREKANSSFLSSVVLGGNINEFVVNNSPAANFFPKYNVGVSVPLDIFARNKAEKRTANEMITFSLAQKKLVDDALKAKVLILYENYKEKKSLLELQRIVTYDDEAAYEKAQKDFKDDISTIENVNGIYRTLLNSKAILISRERDLNTAIIELEEIIGVPLNSVLYKREN